MDVDLEVGFEVFRHSFLHRLTREQRSKSFLAQGITFCSMVPMRSIPFRVIAMLGMDYDKFPRRDSGVSFSHLVSGEPRPGDRNVRNNDRHLFLETILSARDILYISYRYRDERDAELRPPSPLVDELVDYVAKGMSDAPDAVKLRESWLLQHPLHGFSSAYFQPDAKLRNYLPESRFQSGIPVPLGEPRTQVFDLEVVDIDRLAVFLQNPPRTLLQRQFNISYHDEELLLPEHEVFELDSLGQHAVKQDLLRMETEQVRDYAREQQRAGRLPLHNMGPVLAAQIHEGLEVLRSDFEAAREGRMEGIADIDIPLSEGRLTGRVERLYGDRLIEVCTSSNHFKHLVAGYVRYLACLASGRSASFIFITRKIPGLHIIEAGTITPDEALHRLEAFVGHFRVGHERFFPFHPNLAREQFKLLSGNYEAFSDMFETLAENPNVHDFEDPYLQKAIEQGFFGEDSYDALKGNVLEIMEPIRKLMPALFPEKN
jgi:exodeoxyribonuclease V gamma subunit